MKKVRQKKRDMYSPHIKSARELTCDAREATKLQPACTVKTWLCMDGVRKYQLMSTTRERLEKQQKRHAESYKNKIITFSEIVAI